MLIRVILMALMTLVLLMLLVVQVQDGERRRARGGEVFIDKARRLG